MKYAVIVTTNRVIEDGELDMWFDGMSQVYPSEVMDKLRKDNYAVWRSPEATTQIQLYEVPVHAA